MNSCFQAANKKRRGLTLTELAIVLGAMGLVMGAVWAVVGTVWEGYRFDKMKDQVFQVVQNVRDYYGPKGGIQIPTDTDITQTINSNALRLIPVDMRLDPADDTSDINHALSTIAGGSFLVLSQDDGRRFRIRLLDLDQGSCIKLLMQFPVLVPEMGVVRLEANGNSSAIDISNVANPGASVTLPMQLSDATSWCDAAGGVGNEVNFDFRTRY